MGDRRVSKRNIKGTSRFLATVRAASDCEAVPVPPVLAGPPTSGHGDPTLGPQADIENCNFMESDHRTDIGVQDTDSISCPQAGQEQTVGAPVVQGDNDEFESAFREKERELEELRRENEQWDRQEAERQSQLKLAQLDKMIREEREKLNRRSAQPSTPYTAIRQAPSYNQPFQPEEIRYSTAVDRCGETSRTASSPQFKTLYRNLPNLKQFADFKREGRYIKLKIERFEELCEQENVPTDQERYKLLGALLTCEDEENYKNKFAPSCRNYQTLKEFLVGEEGQTSCVLLPRDEKHSVASRDLEDEVGKWMAEMKDVDILRKFVTIHLAPPQLKKKIREKSQLCSKEFNRAVRGLCDAVGHEMRVNARNVSYTNRQAAINRYPNRQQIQAQWPRPATNGYRNSTSGYLCHKHRTFGATARFCAESNRCVMRDDIMPYQPSTPHQQSRSYQPKNLNPNFPQ